MAVDVTLDLCWIVFSILLYLGHSASYNHPPHTYGIHIEWVQLCLSLCFPCGSLCVEYYFAPICRAPMPSNLGHQSLPWLPIWRKYAKNRVSRRACQNGLHRLAEFELAGAGLQAWAWGRAWLGLTYTKYSHCEYFLDIFALVGQHCLLSWSNYRIDQMCTRHGLSPREL
jgi:hypothetical protein